jgi:hypothetical protein
MSWKDTLAKVAPLIATSLGGPMAGMAAKLALDKLGIESAPEEAEAKLEQAVTSGDPQIMLKLKLADQDFKKSMRELGIKEDEIHAKSQANAREFAKAKGIIPQIFLSIVYTTGYCGVMYAFVTGDVQIAAGVKAEFNMVLGVLTAAQVQILNFWFGSSSGSKEKDK